MSEDAEDRIQELKAVHDVALKRIAELEFFLKGAIRLLEEPDLDAEHVERDRKRDEALAKIAAEALAKSFYDYVPRLIRPGDCLWCRESTDRHLNWCPTFVAREALKED